MRRSSLKQIWLIALPLICGAVMSLYQTDLKLRESLQGDLVFSDNLGNIPDFSRMVIEIPEKQVSIEKDDDLWHIEEADNYYASFSKIQTLLDNISSARRGKKLNKIPSEIIWNTIHLFNTQEREIKSVQIGKSLRHKIYYIRYPDNTVYLSTWKMELPDNLYSWTHQPLLEFNGKNVKSIEKDNIIVSRKDEGSAFYNEKNEMPYISQDYLRIFDSLTDLYYEKVRSSQEFSPENYPYRQIMQLTTFDGLIIKLTLYTDKKEYWLQVNLLTNRLPTRQTTEYMAKNSILYEDWWFKIDDVNGQALFNFRF